MIKFKKYSLQMLVLSILISQIGFSNDKITKINFCPQYLPQAQFAGFFVALEKGFYQKYNLEVDIKTYVNNGAVTQGLVSGELDIGTFFLSSAMKLRSEGMKLINIGQVSKQSALILLAKKESNISKPEDINGKKIGIYLDDFNILFYEFIKKYQLDVQVVPVFSGIQLFLNNGTDMTTVMWYNEYHTILNSGFNQEELTPFFLKDYGFDIPEDGIYCLEETYESNAETYGNFVDATMEAWVWAFEHPDEAIDIVIQYMKNANIPANKAHQQWMLNIMGKIIFPDNNFEIKTKLEEKDFEKILNILSQNHYIDNTLDYKQFYKPIGKYAK